MDEISPSVGHDQLSRAIEDILEMTIDEREVPFLVRKPDEGRCTVGQVTKTCLTFSYGVFCVLAGRSLNHAADSAIKLAGAIVHCHPAMPTPNPSSIAVSQPILGFKVRCLSVDDRLAGPNKRIPFFRMDARCPSLRCCWKALVFADDCQLPFRS